MGNKGGALVCAALVSGCVLIRTPNIQRGIHSSEAGRATAPSAPPWSVSEEATAEQLQMGRRIGDAVGAELEWVRAHAAISSGVMHAGEYEVAYVVSPTTGWYEPRSDNYHAPEPGTMHLGVVVRDGADGRTVPGLRVRAALEDQSRRPLFRQALPFGWHPILNRYGTDAPIPPDGAYTLRVIIDAPSFRRHDPTNGDRFGDSTVAEFTNVALARRAWRDADDERPEDSPEAVRLARREGEALARSLYEMIGSEAVNGQVVRLNDYLVAVGVEYSEGYWAMQGDKLRYDISFEQSAARNAHVEVGAFDAATGRFLPNLAASAEVLRDGHSIGRMAQPFMWHPWLYHYGENWRVPRSGAYDIRVHIDPPPYRRYGPRGGGAMSAPIDAVFRGVKIVTGEK